jgi:hypothetical protein
MKEGLTKLFEGHFSLFEVELNIKGGENPQTIKKTVAGTRKAVNHYINSYLKPAYKERGAKLNSTVKCATKYTGNVDILAVPMNTQAT